jgi:hypothetical protein
MCGHGVLLVETVVKVEQEEVLVDLHLEVFK